MGLRNGLGCRVPVQAVVNGQVIVRTCVDCRGPASAVRGPALAVRGSAPAVRRPA